MPVKDTYGGWPTSGEIDIVESGAAKSPENGQVQGTYHSGKNYAADVFETGFYNTTNDPNFNTTTSILTICSGSPAPMPKHPARSSGM